MEEYIFALSVGLAEYNTINNDTIKVKKKKRRRKKILLFHTHSKGFHQFQSPFQPIGKNRNKGKKRTSHQMEEKE